MNSKLQIHKTLNSLHSLSLSLSLSLYIRYQLVTPDSINAGNW